MFENDKDFYEVPFSINNTYLEDDTRPLHISIDDILKISEPGEDFFYEIHQYNSPEDVIYSTWYHENELKFIFDDYFKLEQAYLNSTGRIFGLGERTGEFWLEPGTYTVWPKN